MIPLLGLITKKAKNIEGTEYEKRINSDESSAVYAEMRKRLTKIDYSNNGCYKKYLLKSQIEIVEQRLAIWRKQKGKNIINSESGKWITNKKGGGTTAPAAALALAPATDGALPLFPSSVKPRGVDGNGPVGVALHDEVQGEESAGRVDVVELLAADLQ